MGTHCVFFSDFRAVGVFVHLHIARRGFEAYTLLDMEFDSMTAVEFAYEAPLNVDPMTSLSFGLQRKSKEP